MPNDYLIPRQLLKGTLTQFENLNEALDSKGIKGQYSGVDTLLVASSTIENLYCHIWGQYNKSFSRYQRKAISTKLPPHNQTFLRNKCMEEKYFIFFLRRNIKDNR